MGSARDALPSYSILVARASGFEKRNTNVDGLDNDLCDVYLVELAVPPAVVVVHTPSAAVAAPVLPAELSAVLGRGYLLYEIDRHRNLFFDRHHLGRIVAMAAADEAITVWIYEPILFVVGVLCLVVVNIMAARAVLRRGGFRRLIVLRRLVVVRRRVVGRLVVVVARRRVVGRLVVVFIARRRGVAGRLVVARRSRVAHRRALATAVNRRTGDGSERSRKGEDGGGETHGWY